MWDIAQEDMNDWTSSIIIGSLHTIVSYTWITYNFNFHNWFSFLFAYFFFSCFTLFYFIFLFNPYLLTTYLMRFGFEKKNYKRNGMKDWDGSMNDVWMSLIIKCPHTSLSDSFQNKEKKNFHSTIECIRFIIIFVWY